MKEYSQFKKIISIIMIFILIIQLTGCISYRIISSSDLPESGNYDYIIHRQKSKYPLENTVISNGILSGKLSVEHSYIGHKIQVYLSSDSVMKINSENIITVPIDSIAKVEIAKFSGVKTALIVGACIITIIVLIFPKDFLTGPFILGPI